MKKIQIVFLAFLLIVVGTSTASAHTALIASSPRAQSTISLLPKKISLTFDDPLLVFGKHAINMVQLLNPAGKVITSSTNLVKGGVITNTINAMSSTAGKYRVTFRVVAQDGHVVTGGFIFYVKK